MFDNDYLMRQIEDIAEAMGKVLFEKQSGAEELFNEQDVLSETNFFSYRLNKMVGGGRINEAENLLFDAIGEKADPAYLKVALDFYDTLEKRSEAELKAGNFSREEVLEGLQAIKEIYKI